MDFVRGLSSPDSRSAMQAHLDSGCDACRQQQQFLMQVAETGKASAAEVPDDLILSVRRLFARQPTPGWIDQLQTWVAELVSRVPLHVHPAGVRSLDSGVQRWSGERLLYQAGVYTVDLKLDPPLTSGAGDIIGQISDRRTDAEPLENVLVQVQVAGRIVAETSTNRFGEFLVTGPARPKRAVLWLALREAGCRIEVALPQQEPPSP